MDKNIFCTELVELERAYPGIMAYLKEYKTRQLSALPVMHAAYAADALTDNENAQVAGLEAAITGLTALPGDMTAAIAGLQKQIKTVQGDKAEKAWKARRAHLSANGSSGTKTVTSRDAHEGIVVRCPFGSGYTLFVQVTSEVSYKVWMVTQGDQKEIVELPAFLEGFTVTSLSGIRKLAWAIRNEKTPTACKDGIGQRKKDLEGGSLAEIVSHSPAAWETAQRKINQAKAPKTTAKTAK